MNVTLTALKVSRALSRETTAFSANLLIDGKKVGTATNDGGGSENIVHIPDRQTYDAFRAYCRSLPPVESYGMKLTMGIDLFLSLLVDKYEKKKLTRKGQRTVFVLKSKPNQASIDPRPFTPQVAASVRAEFGDDLQEIVNETVADLD